MIHSINVSKCYGEAGFALKNISFEIATGEFIYLIGKSGSGKSTLLKIIGGEELPTDGCIKVDNYEIKRTSTVNYCEYRREIGIVFQDFRLWQNKTIFENVSYPLEILGIAFDVIKEEVESILEMVGLKGKETSFPRELSGGEEQRVAIARAVVTKPKLLLLDEPTANLDIKNSLKVLTLFENLSKVGVTILMATHDTVIVNKKLHRVLELKNGQLIRDESMAAYRKT